MAFPMVIVNGVMTWLSFTNTQHICLHMLLYMHCHNTATVVMVLKHILRIQTKRKDLWYICSTFVTPGKSQNSAPTAHYEQNVTCFFQARCQFITIEDLPPSSELISAWKCTYF